MELLKQKENRYPSHEKSIETTTGQWQAIVAYITQESGHELKIVPQGMAEDCQAVSGMCKQDVAPLTCAISGTTGTSTYTH